MNILDYRERSRTDLLRDEETFGGLWRARGLASAWKRAWYLGSRNTVLCYSLLPPLRNSQSFFR